MNPLLLLAAVGIGGYLLLKGSSASAATTGPAPTAAQLAASGLTPTTPVYGSPQNPILPPDPAAYGPNGTQPGTPAATLASGPLYHTGVSCVRTGAPLVTDSGGNPFLMF
jgi:hypothetical protein